MEEKLSNDFISNFSHEVRTPLFLIQGYIELIASEKFGPLNDEQRGFVQKIQASVADLQEVATNILDINRTEAGAMEITYETVEFNTFLKQVCETFEIVFSDKDIEFSVEVPNEIVQIRTDIYRVKQVLRNLIGNAYKFTPNRGAVVVKLKKVSKGVQVIVQDSGIGIPPNKIKDVFKKFDRVQFPAVKNYEGSGLGLSLAQNLMRQLGSKIKVKSNGTGQGSEFSFIVLNNQST